MTRDQIEQAAKKWEIVAAGLLIAGLIFASIGIGVPLWFHWAHVIREFWGI